MRLTTSNTHVSLTIFAMSILTTRGEHLRSDLHAGSGAVSGRKLLTAREVASRAAALLGRAELRARALLWRRGMGQLELENANCGDLVG